MPNFLLYLHKVSTFHISNGLFHIVTYFHRSDNIYLLGWVLCIRISINFWSHLFSFKKVAYVLFYHGYLRQILVCYFKFYQLFHVVFQINKVFCAPKLENSFIYIYIYLELKFRVQQWSIWTVRKHKEFLV